jgi:hypothetical protein
MLDATVVAADLSRLVQNSPQQKILGSSLAVLLKRGYPDFRPEDFGSRNLREFIHRYAKEIFESGKRGSDVVYTSALLPAMTEASTRQQELTGMSAAPAVSRRVAIDSSVWKTFASPTAPYRIYANRETGELRVLHVHQSSPEGPWVPVPSCPAPKHLQIAREFIEGLSDEPAKTQLTKILDLDSWWNHFFFSARNFGVERQWSAFRRRRLQDEFVQQLQSLGVPVGGSLRPVVATVPAEAAQPVVVQDGDSPLRAIAAAVIRRMSISELREIWLPLGYVVDEFGKK